MIQITLTQAIVDYVRSHPGAKRSEIIAGIDYQGPSMTVTNLLVRLRTRNVLKHRGGPPKYRQWDVVETKTIPVFLEMANDILLELREVHPSVRAQHLAKRLEDLLGETLEEEY